MKKTIFNGVVNGVNYDCVEDYNNAVTAALKEGKDVEAHSNTQITEVPDEECKCCNCNDDSTAINFNFKGMMEQDIDHLEESLEDFKQAFNGLPCELKKSMMQLVKETKVIAERQLKVTEKDIDAMDAQIAETSERIDSICEHINELEKQIDIYDKQVEELSEKADKQQENYCKLSMVSEALGEVIQESQPAEPEEEEPMTISNLWKSLFGVTEKMLKN